ncbi:D-alanyl-D-alanine carboxypeptidase family protein, partial [Vibrio parahaemolyticus V-223/04]
DTA